MKTLSNLLMSDFIEMSCGHLEVLKEDGENVSNEELSHRANELSYEYKNIINPSGCKAAIVIKHKEMERMAKVTLFRLSLSMLAMGDVDKVREVLSNVLDVNVSKDVLKQRITNELQRVSFEQKRYDEKKLESQESKMNEAEIKNMFDKELASLMVFFKMGIDINKISAGVYANMVYQAYLQIKKQNEMIHK